MQNVKIQNAKLNIADLQNSRMAKGNGNEMLHCLRYKYNDYEILIYVMNIVKILDIEFNENNEILK